MVVDVMVCMDVVCEMIYVCVFVFIRPKAVVDSEHDGSEDNEEDWTYPESRKTAGLKRPRSKDKGSASNSSPHKNGRGPGRPPKQMKDGGRETVNGGSDRERETDNGSAGNGSGSGGGDGRGLGGSFHSLKVMSWCCVSIYWCLNLIGRSSGVWAGVHTSTTSTKLLYIKAVTMMFD